ncbi:uncharacterized protein UTRI_06237 [Ustilago trichophora]|uniref:Uncharacterized protein n=1 Tax=Ustilago trichophora TaxID=86804 RepID=A0A5C3EFL9_9BASI|nr:uncharacterized protein UTRI_06237 [Ustilago trichophora]
MWYRFFLLLSSLFISVQAIPAGFNERAPVDFHARAPSQPEHWLPQTFKISKLGLVDRDTYRILLAAVLVKLNYVHIDYNWIPDEPDQSLDLLPPVIPRNMVQVIRQQMVQAPDRRQMIPLADNKRGLRVFAMPLTHQGFAGFPVTRGSFAGQGESQRVIVFGVADHDHDPTALTLNTGSASEDKPTVKLYGIIGVNRAQDFHTRIAGPQQGRYVAKSLRQILHP